MLVAAAVVAAAALAWVHVVRPELRDAAERAVDDRLAETRRVADGDDRSRAETDTGDSVVEIDPARRSGRRRRAVHDADRGRRRDRTDRLAGLQRPGRLRRSRSPTSSIQNPNRDVGTAALLKNSDTLYEWNLAQLQSNNEFQPRVTELVFQPNDTIVLQVTCEGAGSTVGTGCSIAVLLSGEMRPAT